jgi:acyl-CoA hydrolase
VTDADDAGRDAVPLRDTITERTELLVPAHTNNVDRALGGWVLYWMDVTGAVAAMRFAGRQCVTAGVQLASFEGEIDAGAFVTVEAFVFAAGRTSVDVAVTVSAEDPRRGVDRHETTTGFVTYVAVDESGEPAAVPTLDCPTADESDLRNEALAERRAGVDRLVNRVDSGPVA